MTMTNDNQTAPSAPAQQPDVAATPQPSSEPAREESTEDRSWWQRLRLGRRADDQAVSQADQEAAQAAQASSRTVSQEELDRLVQSETDRRESRRMQQAAAEHRRRLRDEDPYAYAEQERQQEQLVGAQEQQQAFYNQVEQVYDRAYLDKVMHLLEPDEQQAVLSSFPDKTVLGLDNRRRMLDEALKTLEKKWRAAGARDAEAKLRRNQSFRKQVWSEFRGGVAEPELMPAHGGPPSGDDVSSLLRRSIGR
jgi:hypothetical protein